jgi:hypothetical protein
MNAKILGLFAAAIPVTTAGMIQSSPAHAAPWPSEAGVYERYQRYSKAPANDFWYYHPGGPFYGYYEGRRSYRVRGGVWRAHYRPRHHLAVCR